MQTRHYNFAFKMQKIHGNIVSNTRFLYKINQLYKILLILAILFAQSIAETQNAPIFALCFSWY